MKVLLLSKWKPERGGIVTHVEHLMGNSGAEFEILSYEGTIGIPGLRAFSYVVLGLFRGIKADFDLIHAHYTLPQGLLGLLLKRIRRRPLIITVHGSDVTVLGRKGSLRPILGHILGGADRVITVSSFLKGEVTGLGVDPKTVEVVYGGVRVPGEISNTPLPHPDTITFIGSLVPQKGVDVLLEAFGTVKERLPGARLLIVGGGPEGDDLEARRRDLGIKDVDFRGPVEDLTGVYGETTVLALPSREEGFGLVLLEAMARGVPVVATDVGGIPEIVEDRKNGILVPRGDPHALAGALVELLGDAALRAALVKEGKKTSESFTWEGMGTRIDALYKEIAGP